MSDKSIVITEKDILTRFDEMCMETLNPDVYSIWKDQIIPALNKIRRGLKNQKIGMYGDTPRITIGRFVLCEMTIPAGEHVWIEDTLHGDGGEFGKDTLEQAIKDFYLKNL